LVLALQKPWGSTLWADERLATAYGFELSYPLLDRRVVEIALTVPTTFRLPVPRPKPLLAAAFLGEHEETRLKMTFGSFYQALWANLRGDFPELFGPSMLCAKLGYVDPTALPDVGDVRQAVEMLNMVPVELWLQNHF
jgi:hypothetical protein